MVVGIVTGACAVLFLLFVTFVVYKLYRKRRNMKKYQSPSPNSTRHHPCDPKSQVTLMPISAAPRHSATPVQAGVQTVQAGHHTRLDHEGRHHITGTLVHTDMRPPPSYNESFLDNGGSIVAV